MEAKAWWEIWALYHTKLNIEKTKTMASSPNISWQTDGDKVEVVADFIFLGSKIIEDGD